MLRNPLTYLIVGVSMAAVIAVFGQPQGLNTQTAPPSFPQRKQTTADDLFNQYGRCISEGVAKETYINQLVQVVAALEAEVVSLRAAAEKTGPEKPEVKK